MVAKISVRSLEVGDSFGGHIPLVLSRLQRNFLARPFPPSLSLCFSIIFIVGNGDWAVVFLSKKKSVVRKRKRKRKAFSARRQEEDNDDDDDEEEEPPIKPESSSEASDNTAETDIRRFMRLLNSKRVREELEEEERNYVTVEDLYNFPEDPENWKEIDLKELWVENDKTRVGPGSG